MGQIVREAALQHRRTVLLVDQNDDFLDGLCSLLAKDPGFEVVGRAHTGLEAIERARERSPDLVLLDASLTDMSGFQVLPRLKALRPSPLVLLMTFHGSRAAGLAATQAGADRCVSKTGVPGRLLPTLRELFSATETEPRRFTTGGKT